MFNLFHMEMQNTKTLDYCCFLDIMFNFKTYAHIVNISRE